MPVDNRTRIGKKALNAADDGRKGADRYPTLESYAKLQTPSLAHLLEGAFGIASGFAVISVALCHLGERLTGTGYRELIKTWQQLRVYSKLPSGTPTQGGAAACIENAVPTGA